MTLLSLLAGFPVTSDEINSLSEYGKSLLQSGVDFEISEILIEHRPDELEPLGVRFSRTK